MPLKCPLKSKAASAAGLSPAINSNPALRRIIPQKHTIEKAGIPASPCGQEKRNGLKNSTKTALKCTLFVI